MSTQSPWILGLDLGVNSVGWARLSTDLVPLAAGARIFEAGNEGDIEQGKDESRNAKRQQQRSQRRNLWRRAWRLAKVQRMLQHSKLLPPGDSRDPVERDKLFKGLDAELTPKILSTPAKSKKAAINQERHRLAQLLPYVLRAKALDVKLEPYELGRALYHLGQRRGFLSNRKDSKKIESDGANADEAEKKQEAGNKEDAEFGKVKAGIKSLTDAMASGAARTLGEFFSRLNPETERIRTKYTSRKMHQDEFEQIWVAQSKHHPELLTAENKKRIYRSIFKQRPMKSARYRVIWKNKGQPNERKVYVSILAKCELETKYHRAPWAHPVSQRFRMLQKVNDLEAYDKDGVVYKLNDPAHAAMRAELLEALELNGDMTFGKISKLPLFKKQKIKAYNLQKGGEEKIPGDSMSAALRPLFGERWAFIEPAQRNDMVQKLLGIEKEETLKKLALKLYGLAGKEADAFSRIKLPRRYVAHSRLAMDKLLTLMEKGVPYMTARKELYPAGFENQEPLDLLPPALKALPELRNPNVLRALTETRKVVNALLRNFGKPTKIRIELARDLKRGPKDRAELWQKSRGLQKTREAAAADLIKKGLERPSRRDIEKYQLWEECDYHCPYTGKPISFGDLFGPAPKFDVEHIIPFSRCLDDSYLNKTLCCAEFNRNRKKNRAPGEIFDESGKEWNDVLVRLKKLKGDAARIKRERFELEGEALSSYISGFAQRQLNDTKYASRLARRYLGLLYGLKAGQEHTADATGEQRIQVGNGQISAELRNEWKLNSVLNDGPVAQGGHVSKIRDDHRHHSVDAIVIGLTSPEIVKTLSAAAERKDQERRRRFAKIEFPYPGLLGDVKKLIDGVVVSHRVNRNVSGAVHDETYYSPPRNISGKPVARGEYTHVRKPVISLSAGEIENIVDSVVKARVVAALNGGEPSKVFKDGKNLPFMAAKDGRKIPIRKVRIRKKAEVEAVGEGPRQRNVISGANHHIEVFEYTRPDGTSEWRGDVVTLLEAYRRKKAMKPIVCRDKKDGSKFIFSAAGGEMFELDGLKGRVLMQYRTNDYEKNGQPRLWFKYPNDARKISEQTSKAKAKFNKIQPFPNAGMDQVVKKLDDLRLMNPKKVRISPLGEITPASD